MLSRLTNRERKGIWLLATIGASTRLALGLRSPQHLATRPYIEDAFYALSCGRHLALGHGFTVDGVHPTNGVQPLICLLYAPFFWIGGDRWTGLQLTFLLQAVLEVAGAALIAMLVKRIGPESLKSRYSPAIVAAGIWVFSMQLFVHNTNGLETGLVAVLLIWITLLLTYEFTWRRTIAIGILGGLVILARIDCAVYVLLACTWLMVRYPKRMRRAVVVGVLALAISAPWFLYSYQEFGSIMPISGQSELSQALQSHTVVQNLGEAVVALADISTLFFYHQLAVVPWWANLVWVIGVFSVIAYLWSRVNVKPIFINDRMRALTPLLAFAAFTLIYYSLFFGAPHFIARYLHPLRIVAVVFGALLAPQIISALSRSSIAQTLGLAFLLLVLGFTSERYVNNFTMTEVSDLYSAGIWASGHSGARVGMAQSGTSGFVADNVVNLDGKVNADALHARQTGQMGAYISRLDYVIDWPTLIGPTLASAARDGVFFDPIDTLGRVVVYKRRE